MAMDEINLPCSLDYIERSHVGQYPPQLPYLPQLQCLVRLLHFPASSCQQLLMKEVLPDTQPKFLQTLINLFGIGPFIYGTFIYLITVTVTEITECAPPITEYLSEQVSIIVITTIKLIVAKWFLSKGQQTVHLSIEISQPHGGFTTGHIQVGLSVCSEC